MNVYACKVYIYFSFIESLKIYIKKIYVYIFIISKKVLLVLL